ncbi:MAG: DNA (cytosine-5-)-methyltransferase [Phycisphaeraceae bacterium]|nr:DNA (cytosine-5-)-methyltransferase [Phycisphaeraceae bacterium]
MHHNAPPQLSQMPRLRALELCVGAGGLAIAAARAGFTDLTAIDIHGSACDTLRKNKGLGVEFVKDWTIVEADIRDVDYAYYRNIDLLSGGPPCQPFSLGGKRQGRNDEREMFPEFIRAVREAKPKSFVIENVKGLLCRTTSPYLDYIIHQLRLPEYRREKREKWKEHRARLERVYTGGKGEGTQYRVIKQVLNGADYGVPQRRERVFIVGVRTDLSLEYNFPLATHSAESLWRDKWVTGEYWERHGIPKHKRNEAPPAVIAKLESMVPTNITQSWRTVRDAIRGLPFVGMGRTCHTFPNHFFNPGARAYKGHSGSLLDTPAKTIKAGHNGVPGGENMIRLDDGSVRYFTVRECARLQTFPDDWVFDGSWCGCMRQIGNAVPVKLGEVVAAPLAQSLQQLVAQEAALRD